MKYLSGLLLVCYLISGYSQSTVESIPNQKLINNSYVSNPDGILDASTVAQIDIILKTLEEKSTAQVALVAVRSIGEADIFDFAQQLFVSWGIGSKENDNGLLLLLVQDQHAIRFHTGDGLEGILPDATCKGIQRDYMVPEFKNGDYNAGMLAGIKEIERILTDPAYAEELKKPSEDELSEYGAFVVFILAFCAPVFLIIYFTKAINGKFANSKKTEFTLYPEMRMKRWHWLIVFGGIPGIIVALFGLQSTDDSAGLAFLSLYGYYLLTVFYKLIRTKKVMNRFLRERDYYQIVEFLRSSQWYWFFMALFFPLPFAAYFFYHLMRKRIYRNHSRQCTLCQSDMQKLDEKADDAYLTKAQQMEETLRAINYDVWQCKSCQATEEWNYPNRSSKYKECPSCKTSAYHFVSRKTIVSATYSSNGSGEEVHACKFCGKTGKSKYTIAQLVQSSSSSSGSSFSSSSSSGGGSWGGGSSSGGGASSRW
jgi:uncharacterized protein